MRVCNAFLDRLPYYFVQFPAQNNDFLAGDPSTGGSQKNILLVETVYHANRQGAAPVWCFCPGLPLYRYRFTVR